MAKRALSRLAGRGFALNTKHGRDAEAGAADAGRGAEGAGRAVAASWADGAQPVPVQAAIGRAGGTAGGLPGVDARGGVRGLQLTGFLNRLELPRRCSLRARIVAIAVAVVWHKVLTGIQRPALSISQPVTLAPTIPLIRAIADTLRRLLRSKPPALPTAAMPTKAVGGGEPPLGLDAEMQRW